MAKSPPHLASSATLPASSRSRSRFLLLILKDRDQKISEVSTYLMVFRGRFVGVLESLAERNNTLVQIKFLQETSSTEE